MQGTLVGLESRTFVPSSSDHRFDNDVFDRDPVQLPERVAQRELHGQADAATAMKPLLDARWNAVGSASCEHDDQDGQWLGLRTR